MTSILKNLYPAISTLYSLIHFTEISRRTHTYFSINIKGCWQRKHECDNVLQYNLVYIYFLSPSAIIFVPLRWRVSLCINAKLSRSSIHGWIISYRQEKERTLKRDNLTLGRLSAIMLIVYAVVCYILSFVVYEREDYHNQINDDDGKCCAKEGQ